MTIRRGDAWGEEVESPTDLFLAPTDAVAGALVADALANGREVPPLGLTGGDLARTLGGGAEGRFPGRVMRAPLDVVRVDVGEEQTWAVAHVVARRSWWRGEVALAMNAQFFGRYDVAPRSHPNDGRVDIVRIDARMGLRTRLVARARARVGMHVPHPQIEARQTPGTTLRFDRPLTIWIDGVKWMKASEVMLTVEPDALIAHA